MDETGIQERLTVRCVMSSMIKSEVSGEVVLRGQTDLPKSSCIYSPMELVRNCRSNDNDPADRTNERLATNNDGINNPSNGIENKQPSNSNCSVNKLNTNGLDNKTSKIKQIVEDAISPASKQNVMKILDQVNELSTAEKLLLYLKLPTGKSGSVDPLRQPLNPLGSRFEIHQTITWIRTHLEEDPDVSLPKQDVYDEYIGYCNANAMKPLSTADFGKVMKQVFPRVRPRRLGTRGNSRYCYAGMRKRMKLEAPLLPDLSEETKLGGESCSEDEVVSAASCLICEWAQKLLGVTFKNLRELACHLVENLCVDSRSVAAFTVLSANKAAPTKASLPAAPPSKHRETQLQLQRKLQEREVIREQKRKLQELSRGKGKRAKPSQGDSPEGLICDKPARGRGSKPQAASRRCSKPPVGVGVKLLNGSDESTSTKNPPTGEGKLPIPRLSQASKQLPNVIIIPSLLQPKSPKKKYKPIQPKPEGDAMSIGCLERDALDDYLHGGGNSQEQEEELARYFQQEPDKSDKLSQLRLLLERNLNKEPAPPNPAPPGPASASLSLLSQRSQTRAASKPALLLPNGGAGAGLGSRRRVSFETSVTEHPHDSVPPSPNTRRRIFSFTPISPGPHSPLGTQRAPSKPSSANASPFVSPRNTPVPRSRHNSGQHRHAKVVRSNSVNSAPPRPRPVQSGDLFAVPSSRQAVAPPMSPLSISAPQSPMIPFQPLLTLPDTFPTPPLAQEVSQFFPEEHALASSQRSQSVPLHRMASALVSPLAGPAHDFAPTAFDIGAFTPSAASSVAPTPVPSEFADFVSAGDASAADLLMEDGAETGLNSESLSRIFNLLDDVQQRGELPQPSRSYPNTPLPYTRDPVVTSFAAALPSDGTVSRSYPSTPLVGLPSLDEELALDSLDCDSLTQLVQEVSSDN